jgi:hypothetical protein
MIHDRDAAFEHNDQARRYITLAEQHVIRRNRPDRPGVL